MIIPGFLMLIIMVLYLLNVQNNQIFLTMIEKTQCCVKIGQNERIKI